MEQIITDPDERVTRREVIRGGVVLVSLLALAGCGKKGRMKSPEGSEGGYPRRYPPTE